MRLESTLLSNCKGFVDGNWVDAASTKTFGVFNPADGQLLTNVPDMFEEDCKLAVSAAETAFKEWSSKTAKVC